MLMLIDPSDQIASYAGIENGFVGTRRDVYIIFFGHFWTLICRFLSRRLLRNDKTDCHSQPKQR